MLTSTIEFYSKFQSTIILTLQFLTFLQVHTFYRIFMVFLWYPESLVRCRTVCVPPRLMGRFALGVLSVHNSFRCGKRSPNSSTTEAVITLLFNFGRAGIGSVGSRQSTVSCSVSTEPWYRVEVVSSLSAQRCVTDWSWLVLCFWGA